ncbi:MAG: radical SAM protein [Candidatus Omnitrophica bacterium]|nr:radical SAM protein [Candidatus Omnitrophota bacterium]
MSVVLVKPNEKRKQYGRVVHLSAIEPPIWLVLFAQKFPGAKIVDMEAEGLDGAGLLVRLKELAAERVVVLAIGSHPSAHIQQTEAAENLRNLIVTALRLPVDVYNHLVFNPVEMAPPDWSLVPVKSYRAHNWHSWGRKDKSYGAVFSSISCPFSCEFCCVKDFYRSDYTQREPRLLLDDVRGLVDKGITNFKMMDELFAINNKGVHAVLELLKASGLGSEINIWAYARIDTVDAALLKKLRSAGILWLAYGIESGDENIRKDIMKGRFDNAKIRDVIRMTKDAGIHIIGNYMFGFWDDNLDTMRATFDLSRELLCEYSNFYCVTAYPGSQLYEDMKSRGIDMPQTGEEFSQMSPRFKPVPTKHLSGLDVLRFRDNAFNEYYSDGKYLSFMGSKFGSVVVDEIQDMLKVKIREKV